jgi:hypothetical protein
MSKSILVVLSLLSLLHVSTAAIFKASVVTVYDALAADADYTSLKTLVDSRYAAHLKKKLQDPAFRGTLFAPTNEVCAVPH